MEAQLLGEKSAPPPRDRAAELLEVKLEVAEVKMENLEVSNSNDRGQDDTPLDQLVVLDPQADSQQIVAVELQTTTTTAAPSSMVTDEDPEIFGPFSKSQLEPNFKLPVDETVFNAFADTVEILKSALGGFSN